MISIRTTVLLASLAGLQLCVAAASAQVTVKISEPAIVKVEDLFKQADSVAVIRIVSGDLEHYPTAVYKAEVLKTFKGPAVGAKIFFGPFSGYSLGGEYLIFLRRSQKQIEPSHSSETATPTYGRILSFYEVMYEGYSAMPVKYVCVFDGDEIKDQCDDGIKVETNQVVLPSRIQTFPSESDDTTDSDYKWIRKAALISLLQTFVE